MAKHLELSESSLHRLRKLDFYGFHQTWDVPNDISSSTQLLLGQNPPLLQDKNIFLEHVQAFYMPKCEVKLKGEWSTFGTSAETRGTVSLAMVKEEECSNLSLLSGVRKHTEEVMKNSPKQEESDLVSLPWGSFSSSRKGRGGGRR